MPDADDTLLISDGTVSAVISPSLGAGLERFDYVGDGRREPIFRPRPVDNEDSAPDLAMILLVPFSNRVSRGGFWFRETFYPLLPNVEGEPFPIHGDGFSQPWEVLGQTSKSARLHLLSNRTSPFNYAATISYSVAGGDLAMHLGIENRGDTALPFGLGFHPWLIRTSDVELHAAASAVWPEDEAHLRLEDRPVPLPPTWDFNRPAALPSGFINNAFAGWPGGATVRWPDRQLVLQVQASPALSTYILYSPSAAADFFCFEPVTHPVDAFNLPGDPAANGLIMLSPGECTVVSVRFSARRTA